MALINSADVRPGAILTLAATVSAQRQQSIDRDLLLDLVCPPGWATQTDTEKSLAAALNINFLKRDGDRIVAPVETAAAYKKGWSGLIGELRRRVLAPECNTAPWGGFDGARDLTNALAWLLSVEDATQLSGSRAAEEAQRRDFGSREQGWIFTETRWPAIPRWAVGLGFARVDPGEVLVPDPAAAIRGSLPEVFGTSEELPVAEFSSRLATQLPVLDGGEYRLHVASNRKRGSEPADRMSLSLTRALKRLQGSGVLRIAARSDAPAVRLSTGEGVSHIVMGVLP